MPIRSQDILINIWNRIIDIEKYYTTPSGSITQACQQRSPYIGFYWRYHVQYYSDEQWNLMPYPEYEPLYVSTHGRVLRQNGFITGGCLHNGYSNITIYYKNSKRRATLLLHRVIAATFLGRNDDLIVNHKDGNKANNNIYNLEYVTHRENLIHAINTELRVVKQVAQYDLNGKFIKVHNGIGNASRDSGAHESNISKACLGHIKSSGGFNWRYLDG